MLSPSRKPARDLGQLIAALPEPRRSVDWPIGEQPIDWFIPRSIDAAKNTLARRDGRHQEQRFTGAPITGFGVLA